MVELVETMLELHKQLPIPVDGWLSRAEFSDVLLYAG